MIIEPYISVGDLKFADTRDQIREKIGCPYKVGEKSFNDIKDFYDHFVNKDVMVFYDSHDVVQAFEFFAPIITFKEINILQTTSIALIKYFLGLDEDLKINPNGFESYKYGIGIYDPNDHEYLGSYPYSAIIFRKGYYDK